MGTKLIVMKGEKYGKWVVLGKERKCGAKWQMLCICECKRKYFVTISNLINGSSFSCVHCSHKGYKNNIGDVLNRLIVGENGCCWEWIGSCNKGYGVVGFNGKVVSVHKLIYEFVYGPVLEGLELGHLCENPRCARICHLKLMTHKENMLMGSNPFAMKARQIHCIRWHELYGANLYVKPDGRRVCRQCAIDYQNKYRQIYGRPIRGVGWR